MARSNASEPVDYNESEEGEIKDWMRSPPSIGGSPPRADFDHRSASARKVVKPIKYPRAFKRCDCCVPVWMTLKEATIDTLTGYIDTSQSHVFTPLFHIEELAKDPSLLAMNLTERGKTNYVIDLFFRYRYFGGRRLRTEAKPLFHSWNMFIDHCRRNTDSFERMIAKVEECETKFYSRDREGPTIEIHRMSHNLGISCCVPPRVFCPMCRNPPRRITKTSKIFGSLPEEMKKKISLLESRASSTQRARAVAEASAAPITSDVEEEITSRAVSDIVTNRAGVESPQSRYLQRDRAARTRSPDRVRPPAKSAVAPKSQKQAKSQATARDTRARSHSYSEFEYLDEIQSSQRRSGKTRSSPREEEALDVRESQSTRVVAYGVGESPPMSPVSEARFRDLETAQRRDRAEMKARMSMLEAQIYGLYRRLGDKP